MTLPTGFWTSAFASTNIAKGSSVNVGNSLISGRKVYAIPDGTTSAPICVLDTFTDTSSLITAPSSGNYWWGFKSVLAANGCIYSSPRLSPGVLKVDTATDTATEITVAGGGGPDRWEGGFIKSPVDGVLWASPRRESRVLRIDPATDTISFVALGLVYPEYFGGGFDAAGNFYIPPGLSAQISKVTPGGTVTAVTGASVDGSTLAKYIGEGVLAPNGNLYFAPYNGTRFLKIDPAGNSGAGAASLIGPTYALNTTRYFDGVLVGTNIYFAGYGAGIHDVIKIDTTTDTVTVIGSAAPGGWSRPVLYNGNSFIFPSIQSSDKILRLWPDTDTIQIISVTANTSSYRNLVRSPNGHYYAIGGANSTSTKVTMTTLTALRMMWCKNGTGGFQEWYAGLCPQGATGDLEGAFADDQIFAALRTTTATNYRSKRATTSLATGVWYHVAQVATATTVELYVNGVNVGVAPTAGAGTRIGDQAAPLSIGGFLTTPAYSHRGRMALVSFIPAALSAGQILAHYNGRSSKSTYVAAVTGDLIAGSSFWQMQETSGMIQDSAVAARHATAAVGGPVYAQAGPVTGSTSVALDGDSLFSVPDDALFSSADFTMEGWVLFTADGGAVTHTGLMSS